MNWGSSDNFNVSVIHGPRPNRDLMAGASRQSLGQVESPATSREAVSGFSAT